MGHWFWNLWFSYAWPSDKGNGPEAIQQTIAYAAIAVVFVPVVRRWIKREADKIHNELHAHLHHISDHLGVPRYERKDKPKEG